MPTISWKMAKLSPAFGALGLSSTPAKMDLPEKSVIKARAGSSTGTSTDYKFHIVWNFILAPVKDQDHRVHQ